MKKIITGILLITAAIWVAHHYDLITLLMLSCLALTWLIIVLVAKIFGSDKRSYGFNDFFIGDEGGYSLSRLQAVLWAIIIVSYQITVILTLTLNAKIQYYQLVFSEETLWLLGLSLGSYVSIKAITVEKIIKHPERLKKKKAPKLRDFISGDNGLDFSKFQMLIWTILALFIFETKCYYHLSKLKIANTDGISELFNTQLDQFAETADLKEKDKTPVPYLPWSFIVLMGLSQGAYVGKRLVPTFKLDDLKASRERSLEELQEDLRVKERLLQSIYAKTSGTAITDLDKQSIQNLQEEVSGVRQKIQQYTSDIEKINSYK